jgi:hypothetical protein
LAAYADIEQADQERMISFREVVVCRQTTVTQLQEIRYEMKTLRVSEKTLQTEL